MTIRSPNGSSARQPPRTMPLQKLRIVEIVRERGHVVAMTCDGVTDAPALALQISGWRWDMADGDRTERPQIWFLIDDEFTTLVEEAGSGTTCAAHSACFLAVTPAR